MGRTWPDHWLLSGSSPGLSLAADLNIQTSNGTSGCSTGPSASQARNYLYLSRHSSQSTSPPSPCLLHLTSQQYHPHNSSQDSPQHLIITELYQLSLLGNFQIHPSACPSNASCLIISPGADSSLSLLTDLHVSRG